MRASIMTCSGTTRLFVVLKITGVPETSLETTVNNIYSHNPMIFLVQQLR